jgi:aminoglycoside phosphotransferase (APT) family kinase protein
MVDALLTVGLTDSVVGLDGRSLLAEGREAEIYEWGDERVLRLLRVGASARSAAVESAAMTTAAAIGVPVPSVYGTVTIDGRHGVIMDRVDGPNLFEVFGRQPWRLGAAARLLGTTHAQLHRIAAPAELPALRERARICIESAADLPSGLGALALRELDRLPDGDRLCHGDFHPGNVLLGGAGPVVIDWGNAARGDPIADFARTRLMLRLGDVPPGVPWLVQRLHPLGRAALRALYMRAYRSRRTVEASSADRWEVVRAAERFAEGIESELPALRRLLERRASAVTQRGA